LKGTLSARLAPLLQTEVAKIMKLEWAQAFSNAWKVAFTTKNILDEWRRSRILPFDPEKFFDIFKFFYLRHYLLHQVFTNSRYYIREIKTLPI